MGKDKRDLFRGAPTSELRRTLKSCRGALVGIALLSGILNLLFLTGSFYMLEVYDRVLPSGSVPTLVGLAIIVTVLYAFQGAIDIVRSGLLTRLGTAIDEAISGRTFLAVTRLPLLSGGIDSIQPSRDLDTVRGFMSGQGLAALFDLPWIPLYLIICFAFHPAIGWTATIGGLVLVAITLCTELLSRKPVEAASSLNRERNSLSDVFKRNAEVLRALGMERRMGTVWAEVNTTLVTAQQRTADISSALGAVSKVTRMLLQSAVLTVGAYLVINQQATGGVIIASSILTSRALAPVEMAIGQWKSFIAARGAWARLSAVLERLPADTDHIDLPAPKRQLFVENVSVGSPGSRTLIVQDVSFRIEAGQGLGIVGPSASGKSSLVRALVGVWNPLDGAVRLDGASIDQWSSERLGANIGYLPQDVQLFPGTIAQNIARFDPDATSDAVIHAARAAGVHDLVVRLPNGYSTSVGDAGHLLSAGQRQRIGLARALFGNPFLVVLDEPNSNLDSQGEDALTSAISSVRERGGIVIVVAHRPSALAAVDLVLMMANGRAQAFGEKDDVLGRILKGDAVSTLPPVARPMLGPKRAEAA